MQAAIFELLHQKRGYPVSMKLEMKAQHNNLICSNKMTVSSF